MCGLPGSERALQQRPPQPYALREPAGAVCQLLWASCKLRAVHWSPGSGSLVRLQHMQLNDVQVTATNLHEGGVAAKAAKGMHVGCTRVQLQQLGAHTLQEPAH